MNQPRHQTIAGPGVPMEPAAVDQLARVACLDGCHRAVGMPDLHTGPGIPIGACFAFDRIRPALVGTDAGCGVRLTVVRAKHKGDALERRVREAFGGPAFPDGRSSQALFPEAVARAAAEAAWTSGVLGLAGVAGLPERLRALAAEAPPLASLPPSAPPPALLAGLGTIGGGNHFAEISRIDAVSDPAAAHALGLESGATALLVHSGSRGVGAALGRGWGDCALVGDRGATYLSELAGAVRFAVANRFVITWRLLLATGAARPDRIAHAFDVCHNGVTPLRLDGRDLWLHRKGCAPAGLGESTIVLGSRGTPSWVMCGTGQAATLLSVAHGAGRRISRTDARTRFRRKGTRKQLQRTTLGGRVICEDPKLLYEEHPEAYKPIEPVIAAIEHAGMATRIASLVPMVTVKK